MSRVIQDGSQFISETRLYRWYLFKAKYLDDQALLGIQFC